MAEKPNPHFEFELEIKLMKQQLKELTAQVSAIAYAFKKIREMFGLKEKEIEFVDSSSDDDEQTSFSCDDLAEGKHDQPSFSSNSF